MSTQYNASTWTGTYSSYSRNFCGYVIYNWYPNYSETQSLFQIVEIGVRQTSSGSTTWSGGSAQVSVAGTGQTTKSVSKSLSSSTTITWTGAANRSLNTSTTNWYWTKTTTSQTKTIKVTGAKTAGAWSGSNSSSFTVTVPALQSYTIEYDANGGSGTISDETKYYGVNVTLNSGSSFTYSNHTLIGWNTAADGSGTHFDLGATYSANAGLTLYAEWHLDYISPSISNTSIYRVASSSSTTETDDGEYIRVSFDYVGGSLDGGVTHVIPTCKVTIDGTDVRDSALPNASGSFAANYGTYSKDTAHVVAVMLYDSNDPEGVSLEVDINTATYPLDLIGSGTNVYMGIMVPAESGTVLKLHEFKTEDVYLDMPDYQTASTTDKALYDAIVALGWDSDVLS